MTLPASGTLTVSGIRTELGSSGQTNLGGAGPRSLSGIASGVIKMSDFYGKTAVPAGSLWRFGSNAPGSLGDNTVTSKSSPVQTISGGTNWKQAGGGMSHSAAIKTDGTLWSSGDNTNGFLGDNTRVNKSSPVQTIAGGTNWKSLGFGSSSTFAIKTDGTLWVWGANAFGMLGDGTTAHKSSPVQTIAGGTNWAQVSGGYYHLCAIKTDGTLWTCGYNSSGQLGDGTIVNKSSPVQIVSGGTNWKQVSGARLHASAVKTDGTLWVWGDNVAGQLGDNTVVKKSSPVQTVAGGTNWSQVSCGYNFTAAIKTDGTLWLWGINAAGQLGDNTSVKKSSPVQTIAGGTNWKQVYDASSGYSHVAALKTDGTLWLWGDNTNGQLGDNTVVKKSSPIQTVAGGTAWKTVGAFGFSTSAIK